MTGTRIGTMTRRIIAIVNRATTSELEQGMNWYADAHAAAVSMGIESGRTTDQAAGVIAALSPVMPWGRNLELAGQATRAGHIDGGALPLSTERANRILAGEPIETVLGGEKVTNFYRCIASRGKDANAVCIDRHAIAVAHNTRTEVPVTPKRYRDAAQAYRNAARILTERRGGDITPAQAQAIAWVTWRRIHGQDHHG